MGVTAASTRPGELRRDMLQQYMVRSWRTGEVLSSIMLQYFRRVYVYGQENIHHLEYISSRTTVVYAGQNI